MTNEPPGGVPGRGPRLTRRSRLALMVTAVLVVAAVVLVPVVLLGGGGGGGRKTATSLVVPEGRRADQVYASVDRALDVPDGTTRKAAGATRLGLPEAAGGNPEGYLFPATYPIDPTTTPASLLSFMVNTANQRFGTERVIRGAERNGLTVYEAVTVASIVQAEADTAADMGKVARVVHNRLARSMPLQLDSTLNYALHRSALDTTHEDRKTDSPYNTYENEGLPPSPIGNPGDQAMNAAINPTRGDWLYFVTVAPGDTRFTHSYAEQRENVRKFNENRRSASREAKP
ncbi:endolytic transglycosylase MltG [Streptomyces sp. NPDC051569]|uniref:endolytic transglycosylase MltG n=1 Tax=Streptomyces sp. NPDC051569 TaxID=3365661 RepID=UPI00379C3141